MLANPHRSHKYVLRPSLHRQSYERLELARDYVGNLKMAELSDTNFAELNRKSTERLGFTSAVLALAVIPLLLISVYRVHSLQKAEVCLVRETLLYRTLDTLCFVLPCVSVTSGVLSLIRCRRSKLRLPSAIPALVGIILAITAFSIYFLALLALSRGNLY